MSTRVVGFRPPDDHWKQMVAAWEACKTVGVDPPKEVCEFFGHEEPAGRPGMEVPLGGAVTKWRDDCREGFDVDLSKLPAGVRFLRFYNAW